MPSCDTYIRRGETCKGPRVGRGELEFRNESATIFTASQQDEKISAAVQTTSLPSRITFVPEDKGAKKRPPRSKATGFQDLCSTFNTTKLPPSLLGSSFDDLDIGDEVFSKHLLGLKVIKSMSDAMIPRLPAGGAYGNAGIGLFTMSPVLARVNSFWRHGMLPTSAALEGFNVSDHMFEMSVLSLYDLSAGCAFIIHIAHCYLAVAQHDPDVLELLMSTRHQALRHLRRQIGSGAFNAGHVLSMLAYELTTANYPAATTHASFLFKLLEEKDPAPASGALYISDSDRHRLYWHETERATAMMVPTWGSIEERNITTDALTDWAMNSGDAPLVSQNTATAFVDIATLHDFCLADFTMRAQLFDCYMYVGLKAEHITRRAAWELSHALIILSGQLINYAVDLTNAPLHRAAALAILFIMRLRTRSETSSAASGLVPGDAYIIKQSSQGPAIASKKALLLQETERRRSVTSAGSSRASSAFISDEVSTNLPPPETRLLIWILTVGAYIEQTAEYPLSEPPPNTHQQSLKFHLAATGLDADTAAYATLLSGFLTVPKLRKPEYIELLLHRPKRHASAVSTSFANKASTTAMTSKRQQGEQSSTTKDDPGQQPPQQQDEYMYV